MYLYSEDQSRFTLFTIIDNNLYIIETPTTTSQTTYVSTMG